MWKFSKKPEAKMKLKEDVRLSAESLPELSGDTSNVPVEHKPVSAGVDAEPESPGNLASEGSQITSKLLPSRRQKLPRKRDILLATGAFLSIVPLLLVSFVSVTDRAAIPYVSGRHEEFLDNGEKAVKAFTEAIAVRKDPLFYFERARCFAKLGKAKERYQDLQSAVKLGMPGTQIRYDLALAGALLDHSQLETDRILKAGLQLSSTPDETGTDVGRISYTDFNDQFAELLSNDPAFVLQMCKNELNRKTDQVTARRRSSVKYLEAMAHRSLGQTAQCAALLKEVSEDQFFPESFYSIPSFKRLLSLDARNTSAEEEKEMKEQAKSDWGITDLSLQLAWLAFEKGDMKGALSATDKFLKADKQLDVSFSEMQQLAACRLLRQHIFLNQRDFQKAEKEQIEYDAINATGEFFIPRPYRSWL